MQDCSILFYIFIWDRSPFYSSSDDSPTLHIIRILPPSFPYVHGALSMNFSILSLLLASISQISQYISPSAFQSFSIPRNSISLEIPWVAVSIVRQSVRFLILLQHCFTPCILSCTSYFHCITSALSISSVDFSRPNLFFRTSHSWCWMSPRVPLASFIFGILISLPVTPGC